MPRADHLTIRNRYRNSGIALLMLLGSFVNPAAASERADNGLSPKERDPNHWIEKMGTALIEENYRGVFTIARGREFNSIEIDHRYQDGVVTEHLTQQNGPHRKVIRHGQSIECFHEDSASSLDHAVHLGPFSQSFNASLQAQSNHYVSKIIGVDRVAGRQAVVLSVQASAGDRFGFMLWIDRERGLLLQSHLVDRGRILEVFQFASVDFDSASPLASKASEYRGWIAHSLTEEVMTASEKPSFKVKWMPAGYRIVSSSKHRVHFSDGVSDFSIFLDLGRVAPKVATEIKGRTIVTRPLRSQEGQITIVGSLPLPTAERLAESVESVVY